MQNISMEERAIQLFNESKKQESIVDQERSRALQDIQGSEDFKKASDELYNKEVQEDFRERGLEIADKALQNDYNQYALTKKKELLDLRVKKEKNLVKEQVEAEVQEQKIANAIRRYGYLTPLLDENGQVVKDENGNIVVDMSKFTPNKLSNKFKELEFNYSNMSKTAKKVIWTTIKTVFFVGMIALAGWLIVKYVVPLIQAIPQI